MNSHSGNDTPTNDESWDIPDIEPQKTVIYGVVVKLDNVLRKVVVRVTLKQDAILTGSDQTRYGELDYVPLDHYLYIPYEVVEKRNEYINLGAIVQILDYEGNRIPTGFEDAKLFNNKGPADIKEYRLKIVKTSAYKLVAVTTVHSNYLKVVGSSFAECIVEFPIDNSHIQQKKIEEHSFMYGCLITLPEHYKAVIKNEQPELIFNHESRFASMKTFKSRAPLLVTKIRHLTEIEAETIQWQTRNLKEIDYSKASKYVLEPLLVVAALKDCLAGKSEQEFTCEVANLIFDIRQRFDAYRYAIYVPMTENIKKCLNARGKDTWRLGSDLVLRCEIFGENNITLVLEEINVTRDDTVYILLHCRSWYNPVLESISQSEIRNNQRDINWFEVEFTLGPMSFELIKSSESIIDDFYIFYDKQFSLFEAFIGRSDAPVRRDISEIEEYIQESEEQLDDSQLTALKTALATPGFSCISAPPGSGKTFLISQLIVSKLQEDPFARFAVSAATNIAVTNVVDTVKMKLPRKAKCIRQFSPKAEAGLAKNERILQYSLTQMIKSSLYTFPLRSHPTFNDAMEIWEYRSSEVKQTTGSVIKQLIAVDKLRRAESNLGVQFLRYYGPEVFGTTASILGGVNRELITNLVIDDASQISQVDLLFILCRLPHLEYVTLIGDSRQLGVHTYINKGTQAYELSHKGELTRLEGLRSVAKEQLTHIYRAHPKIVDLLMKPVYGPQLISAIEAADRSLAEEKDLPRASYDGAPCLFVHVDGKEHNCRNDKELEVVCKLLEELEQKGVENEDISIICNHKAQKDSLCQRFKGQGNYGSLNLKYSINTVDAYQGKEAKVVVVLTTKTCGTNGATDAEAMRAMKQTLQFVCDPQRETVAVTRAQHGVYIFGNWKELSHMPFWSQFGPGIINSGAVVNENWMPIRIPGWSDAVNNRHQ